MKSADSYIKSSLIKATLLASLLVSISYGCLAQVTQTHRFELEHKNSNEYFTTISLKNEGIALLRSTDKYEGMKMKWQLLVLDTALQQKHDLTLLVESRNVVIGYEYSPGMVYILYRMGESTKSKLMLIGVDIATGTEASRHEIDFDLDLRVTHFIKSGASMVFGGYVNNEPAILLFNMKDAQIKVIPGFFQHDTELVDLRANQNETFNTILLDKSNKNERKLHFRTFDETGSKLLEASAPVDENKTLHTTQVSALEREDLMVFGTWGAKTGRQSSGLFSWAIDPFNDGKLRYTHFGELEHFLDYLSPKRAKRIKENTKEDLKLDKRPAFVAYANPFRVFEHAGGFVLLVEVYEPHTTNPYNNPFYGNSYSYIPGPGGTFWPGYYPGMRMYRAPYNYAAPTRTTDNVRFYETAVIAFDPTGKPTWDHSIKLDDIDGMSLEQRGDFYLNGSTLTLMYKKESEVMEKVIDVASGTSNDAAIKVKVNDPADEIRSEREHEGGINSWYGNNFYLWGYQTIRNNSRSDRVRDVFYINKIVAH